MKIVGYYAKILHMSTLQSNGLNKTFVQKNTKKKKFSLKMPKKTDYWIFYATILLLLYGALMVMSASMGQAVSDGLVLIKTLVKEVLFIVAGYIAMTFFSQRFTLNFLKSEGVGWLIGFTAVALFACLAFPASGGAKAWWRLSVAGFELTVQPAEFVKPIAVILIAAYLGDNHNTRKSLFEIIRAPLIVIGLFVLDVFILQKDFGTAMVIALITFLVFLIPSNPKLRMMQKVIAYSLLAIVVLGIVLFTTEFGENLIQAVVPAGYQKNRLLSAINPFADQYGSSYQIVNGLIAFASGGFWGKGIGNSMRKYTDFPAASTDSILAIVVEETGMFGFLVIMALYCVIIFRLFMYAKKIKSEKAKIILVGVALYFVIHIFFNIGGVTAAIPLTGIPLLLVSAGGSSTVSALASLGIAQAIISSYRRGEIQ